MDLKAVADIYICLTTEHCSQDNAQLLITLGCSYYAVLAATLSNRYWCLNEFFTPNPARDYCYNFHQYLVNCCTHPLY